MEGNTATAGTALTRAALAGMIVVGSLALWTVVPVSWLYLTGGLVPHGGTRFVLVLFGCPLTMALMFWALSRVEVRRRLLSPTGESGRLLEVMLVASGVIALVSLVVWWFFIADTANPSGPLQPV
jgi:hypothetical protein